VYTHLPARNVETALAWVRVGGVGKTIPEVSALRVGKDSFHEMAQRVQRASFIMSRDDCAHPRDTADIGTYAKRKWKGPWRH
jgi:NADH:ubiquinone oxidoreductase subunit D